MDKGFEFFPEWWDELVYDGPRPTMSQKVELSPKTPAWVVEEYEKWWMERQARLEEARRCGGLMDKY